MASTASFPVKNSKSRILESIEDLNTPTTIFPEILSEGPKIDIHTPRPSNKISEATIIAISVEETLHIKSSNEKIQSDLEENKNAEASLL